ncbi:Epoxide hydrolase [Pseudomonas savastanoi pv. nerii]|uniref:Epoxide hydrolase n=1 Tax=Pseudomonas savastanoi pv. nerii TaxID=360921 RepID=A0A3M5PG07_PSESS|nr:hypothetical protein AC519_4675 [Pseudomonas savastanoi]KPW73766.1 Epoxide hydrolase [Pseudomonas amygdali pv. ciccaronei]KPY48741.1 Epoxide hydrolase [Pseudomonas savastanoi pv. retacarpa]KPY65738.1 Epoxide hydrolase [Pseudomonas savastanoi pv. savastanoi]RMT71101.1 Epoxide hydrolase [Pseudomonas savastanoi pv. nerii]
MASWAAQGGDWGAAVITALGQVRPLGLIVAHLSMLMSRSTEA